MKLNTSEKRKLQKRESFKRLINLGLTAICIGLEVGVFAYCWMYHFRGSVVEGLQRLWFKGNMLEITIYGVVLFLLSSMYGGMRLGYLKNVEVIFSQVFATLMANVFIYGELSVMAAQLFVPHIFIFMTVTQTMAIIIYINIANRIYRFIFPPRKLLLIHGDRPIERTCAKFESRKDKYVITRTIHAGEGFETVSNSILKLYEEGECNAVLMGDISVEERTPLIKFCYGHSIRVYLLPKITDVILMGAEELHVFDSPMLLTREYSLSVEQRFMKRAIDIICALVLLVCAFPFMLVTAVLIKLYDGGPILYKQVRCTLDQREFHILKFRSMKTDAEKDGVARLAGKNDSRITPIGKFIRKCRIDELPQLINILRGDMSVVGPRPERPQFVEKFKEEIPRYMVKHQVRPGLTGWAQINGYRGDTSIKRRIEHDIFYIENWTMSFDIKIMFLTIFKGFINKNAY